MQAQFLYYSLKNGKFQFLRSALPALTFSAGWNIINLEELQGLAAEFGGF